MTFKLLHTADWQIGMKAAHVGPAAVQVREARLESARRVIALANTCGVDAVILAGDTFEDCNVPRDLIQRVVDILRGSSAPVFVLPGNHDPLIPGNVFEHPAWKDADPAVRVLREMAPYSVGPADLFPCPLAMRTSMDDPLDILPDAPGRRERIRIGVAHGSLLGAGVAADDIESDFPMDRGHVTRAGLDYLALGHWHTPSEHAIEGVIRAAYSGTHEPTCFGEFSAGGERASGQCYVVSVDAPGAVPRLESHRTAVLEWRDVSHRIDSASDMEALRGEIDGEPATSRDLVLLRMVLSGLLSIEDMWALGDLTNLAAQRFLYSRIESGSLALRPADDSWLADLPPGAPSAAARRLLEMAGGSDHQAEQARQALQTLYELHRETVS